MSRIRRVVNAALRLAAVGVLLTVSAAPVRAEATAAELGAAVFAFDFSGSIYCYASGKPDKSCSNPINDDLSDAVNALADKIENDAAKYAERAIDFTVTRFGSGSVGLVVVTANGQRCEGNTKDSIPLLVSCLHAVAELYKSPNNELGGTAFSPALKYLEGVDNQRCGLILFTDGTPDKEDKAIATKLASDTRCAVLPVSTGTGAIDEDYLHTITRTDIPPVAGCSDQKFEWPNVYFPSPDEAADQIGVALNKVACLNPVPSPEACTTVAQYQELLGSQNFSVQLGEGVSGEQYVVIDSIEPKPGSKEVAGSTVTIGKATASPTGNCAPSPTPTVTPPPEPDPGPECVVDGPFSWLGCNPWVLLVLLGLVLSRLWWIARDLQVSINGQEAVGLRGGTKVGFDIQNGTASRTPNPNQGQVKVSRSFFRFLPSTRIDATDLPGSELAKNERFSLGKEVALTPSISARFRYGNPRHVDFQNDVDDSTNFSSGANPSGTSSGL